MLQRLYIILTILAIIYGLNLIFSKRYVNYFKKSFFQNFKKQINNFVIKHSIEYTPRKFYLLQRYDTFLQRIKINFNFFNQLSLIYFKLEIYLISLIISIFIGYIIGNMWMVFPFLLITIITSISILYSTSIRQTYDRIIECINIENLLSPILVTNIDFINIVENNISYFPLIVKKPYENFLRNTKTLNYPISKALHILDEELGYYSSNFLSDVEILMDYTQKGFSKKFEDTIEENGIKILARNRMERLITEINIDFTTGFLISYGLLILEFITIIPVRTFYLKTDIGQILFVINILLLAFMYFVINLLKAQEL